MLNTETSSVAGYIKDGAFCLASPAVFDGFHWLSIKLLALQLPLSTIAESKLAVAVVTGCFLVGARMIEARYSNQWRQRALDAEEELHKQTRLQQEKQCTPLPSISMNRPADA